MPFRIESNLDEQCRRFITTLSCALAQAKPVDGDVPDLTDYLSPVNKAILLALAEKMEKPEKAPDSGEQP